MARRGRGQQTGCRKPWHCTAQQAVASDNQQEKYVKFLPNNLGSVRALLELWQQRGLARESAGQSILRRGFELFLQHKTVPALSVYTPENSKMLRANLSIRAQAGTKKGTKVRSSRGSDKSGAMRGDRALQLRWLLVCSFSRLLHSVCSAHRRQTRLQRKLSPSFCSRIRSAVRSGSQAAMQQFIYVLYMHIVIYCTAA